MTQQLIDHLQKQKIGLVLHQLPEIEKHCAVGLKVMCIIDYYAKKEGVYNAIELNRFGSKFLMNLLRFPAFCTFNYAEYKSDRINDRLLLACKHCKIVGPYLYILSHMAISHNDNVDLKMCNYCNEVTMDEHFKKKTLDACYEKYKEENSIVQNLVQLVKNSVIKKFYDIVNDIAKDLKVRKERPQSYVGAASLNKSRLDLVIGHETTTCSDTNVKIINMEGLQRKFDSVIEKMYNGNGLPNVLWEEDEDGKVTILDSDDEDENENVSSEPVS